MLKIVQTIRHCTKETNAQTAHSFFQTAQANALKIKELFLGFTHRNSQHSKIKTRKPILNYYFCN
tara:strand:+ start:3623 stop:3817 length:195 start_codon:yes stop_codon:yes gene_type:complete